MRRFKDWVKDTLKYNSEGVVNTFMIILGIIMIILSLYLIYLDNKNIL
jgi:hypothetical protein